MSSSKKKPEKRKAYMIIRVEPEVKAAIQAYAGQLRLKKPGKRVTEGEAIADLVRRCAPEIWEAMPEAPPSKKKG